jgi:alkylation response protein AidB-like acyl-CoA dehydrogenase
MVATMVRPARDSASERHPETSEAERLLASVRDLAPALAARSEEIENARRVPNDIVESLRKIGVLRALLPHRNGGFELSIPEVVPVLQALSAADSSVGWAAMIYLNSQLYGTRMQPEMFSQIYGDGSAPVLAGSGAPAGRAEKTDGGYRVSGRWPFVSGCQNAQWMGGHCVIFEDGKPAMAGDAPVTRFIVAPAERFRIEETWQASGLSGTGSHHIVLDNEEIPEIRTFDLVNGTSCVPGPFAVAIMPFMPMLHAAVATGIATGAFDDLVAMAKAGRKQLFASSELRESKVFQQDLGRIGAELRAARALLDVQAATHWRRAVDGELDSTADFTESLQANAWIHTACISVVGGCYTLGGSSVVFNTSPLQRRLRDIHVAKQHLSAQDRLYAGAGALHLGFPPVNPLARL